MAVDWGIVLGVVSVIGIPAGTGIGVTMAAQSPGEFRFARYCFVVAGILTIASWAWLTYGYPLGPFKIVSTGVIGAITAIGIVVALNWISQREPGDSDDAQISVSGTCRDSTLPTAIAGGPDIHFLELHPNPPDDVAGGWGTISGGGGFGFGTWGIECKITNDSGAPIFNVSVPLKLTFIRAVPVEGQPNNFKFGDALPEKIFIASVDRIGKGETSVLYVANQTPFFVRLKLPDKIELLHDHKRLSVELIQPPNIFAQIMPWQDKK